MAPTSTSSRRRTDEVFPGLFDVAELAVSSAILKELFSDHFFVTGPGGAGGFRTVSSAEKEYQPESKDANGLLGGIYFYAGPWMGRAAARKHQPDMALKALRASVLITEMPEPRASNTVPGQFPDGYFTGDRRWNIQEFTPIGPDHAGLYIWSSLESFLGITPRPTGLEVDPVLPEGWGWVAASHISYHGVPLTLLAVREGKTLYATRPVSTAWKTVTAPAALQDRFRFEPEGETFGFVLPVDGGSLEVVAASLTAVELRVIDRQTEGEITHFPIAAGGIVFRKLP